MYRLIKYRYPVKTEFFLQQKNIVGGWTTIFVTGNFSKILAYCIEKSITTEGMTEKIHPESVEI